MCLLEPCGARRVWSTRTIIAACRGTSDSICPYSTGSSEPGYDFGYITGVPVSGQCNLPVDTVQVKSMPDEADQLIPPADEWTSAAAQRILRILEAAIQTEREACAKIAEARGEDATAQGIAAEIRARKTLTRSPTPIRRK
jgi:hypothetical protein